MNTKDHNKDCACIHCETSRIQAEAISQVQEVNEAMSVICNHAAKHGWPRGVEFMGVADRKRLVELKDKVNALKVQIDRAESAKPGDWVYDYDSRLSSRTMNFLNVFYGVKYPKKPHTDCIPSKEEVINDIATGVISRKKCRGYGVKMEKELCRELGIPVPKRYKLRKEWKFDPYTGEKL